MDNEKEISFGAFDSELMHQEITIPEGFEATIDGNKIILTRIENKDEKTRKWLIDTLKGYHHLFEEGGVTKEDMLAWLEKQRTPNRLSIWKHWKDGVCGNGEGKLIYLIKNGYDYSLSSCLGFECDYIELSELDELMLEKQGEQKPIDKIQLGKKYKCITSPRYSTFRRGEIYKPEDNFLCNLMNLCYECFEPIEDSEQKPADKVEPFNKYEGLTDFERTLADICIGWIGEELGWKQYIKDNADVLLKIAIEKFNSVQDVPFEQNPAWNEKQGNPTDDDMKEALRTEYEKGRADAFAQMQKEWSKGDDGVLLEIISVLQNSSHWILADKLKSLKERYTWKPSDEQMEALKQAKTDACGKPYFNALASLYVNLQKS